jgi:hypothetical protein
MKKPGVDRAELQCAAGEMRNGTITMIETLSYHIITGIVRQIGVPLAT